MPISAAQVALQKASSDEVRSFARMMLDDHTKASEQLADAAKGQDLSLPVSVDAPHDQLLQDLASCGRIAVVFSSPSTHRSVQVKGTGINGRAATADDLPLLMRYRQAMEYEICSIGYRVEFLHAMLAFELEDLVAISFTPAEAFDQTPGPKAGSQIVQGAPA